ncbi:MAG: protease modulator HflC [Phycisphaerales bacterium]|nr:MAG: protease modulator HflC [Phycisphaerales bacterium]
MRLSALLILVFAVVALVYACCYVVDETQYVIVTRFGDPVRTVMEPGLGFKWPWPVDSVVRFDNRLMMLEVPRAGEPDREYITLDVESGIGKNVEVTAYACWRIKPDPGSVLAFLESVPGGDRAGAEDVLGDVVGAKLGDALGAHDFSALVSVEPDRRKWDGMLGSIRDACKAEVEGTYGIEIVDVKIQRLNFPDQNRLNVFKRMRAERDRIASRYRSEGKEKATGILAGANKQQEQILATAYMEAQRVRGHADAEAARIYAQAYGQDPDFYEFLRTLQSYEKTFDENTVLILSGDSAFLRLLNQTGGSQTRGFTGASDVSHAGGQATTQPAHRRE